VFAVVYFATSRLRKLSSQLKHLLWFFVICSFIIIAVFQFLAPSFQIAVPRFSGEKGLADRMVTSLLFPQGEYTENVSQSSEAGSAVIKNPYEVRSTDPALSGALKKAQLSNSQTLPAALFNMSFWVLLIWIIGILFSLIKIVMGDIGLLRLTKKAEPVKDGNLHAMVKRLSDELRLRQKVLLLLSTECIIPFTYNVFKPAILLPSDVSEWSMERLRAVLIHELAHIRRKDCLTQYISRIVCALVWFVPLVWVAYKNLLIEQEKACDCFVVSAGEKPADYAAHIVDLVRFSRGRVIRAGIYSALGKKDILERRITHVLRLKGDNLRYKLLHAFRTFIICFLCLLPLLVINPGTAANMGYVAVEDEEIYSAWVNEEYLEKLICVDVEWTLLKQKYVDPNRNMRIGCEPTTIEFKSDGTLISYDKWNDPKIFLSYFLREATYEITDKWTDSGGNIWYKLTRIGKHTNTLEYMLIKISESGKTLEYCASNVRYPTEIDPNSYHYTYRIYYRQDEA
jgi:beta-lactamase regulating signal transducer with metallopeptidase domain